MKLSEFRKLIREEVRKVVNEEASIIKNAEVSVEDDMSTSEMNNMFGSFLTVKQGPTKGKYTNNYVVDLNVDVLTSLLKSDKDYTTVGFDYALMVFYKGSDSVNISSKSIPKDLFTTLVKLGSKFSQKENLVSIQISEPEDDFRVPEDYSIPTVIKSLVGDIKYSPDAEEDEDVFDDDINRYVSKIEKLLLSAGQKVVPGLQKYAIEDGAIIFKIKSNITPDMKAKLKKVFQGAKSIDF
jgi:hypothetical protein